MVEYCVPVDEIVSKILVESGNVYLYSYGTLIAQIDENNFINKARVDTELHELVNLRRQELHNLAVGLLRS